VAVEEQQAMVSEKIATAAEFQSLTKTGRVLVHFDVDWAVQAIQSREPINQLAERISTQSSLNGVRIYRVDCSEQEGELWNYLLEWCSAHKLGNSIVYGGNGALVWLNEGRVADSVEYAGSFTVDELFQKTSNALSDT
jgi:hypothetical protein